MPLTAMKEKNVLLKQAGIGGCYFFCLETPSQSALQSIKKYLQSALDMLLQVWKKKKKNHLQLLPHLSLIYSLNTTHHLNGYQQL